MSDYDYGNARLRAMKSRLLSRRELELLAEGGSLTGLVSALIKTPYRGPVEAALTRSSGMNCIAQAIREDLVSTLGKVRTFYRAEAEKAIATVLRTYDIHNVKAIFRGSSRNIPHGDILDSLLPVGDLPYPILMDLARAPGLREVIDSLASMNLPIAQPLLRLRARRLGMDPFEMELALDQWYYQQALETCNRANGSPEILLSALQLEADLANLQTILRFVQSPDEHKLLRERLGTEDLARLFVGPGTLSFEQLNRAGNQKSIELLVNQLASTAYAAALAAGLDRYRQSGRLSEYEMRLRRHRLNWMANLILKDPLGIGVFLGYLALKTNEIHNLRWIAQGVSLGLKPAAIRAELEFAA